MSYTEKQKGRGVVCMLCVLSEDSRMAISISILYPISTIAIAYTERRK